MHDAAGAKDGAGGCSVEHERHSEAERAQEVRQEGGKAMIAEASFDDIIGLQAHQPCCGRSGAYERNIDGAAAVKRECSQAREMPEGTANVGYFKKIVPTTRYCFKVETSQGGEMRKSAADIGGA